MRTHEAIVQGIVQGLTEFLPISSTAHLRIVPALLGWDDPGAAFTAVIQLGTLAAVFWYFRSDVMRLTHAAVRLIRLRSFRDDPEAFQVVLMIVGTIPIVVCGVIFKSLIETSLRALTVTAIMLIVVGILMAMAEWWSARIAVRETPLRTLSQVRFWDAVVIGLAQAVALIPGTSRSGSTITAGLFLGFDRSTAARYSFLLSLPAIFAAGMYQLVKARHTLLASTDDIVNLLIAATVAGIVGYASIAFLLGYLQRRTMGIFVVYRIALGIMLLVLISRGMISD